MAFKKRRKIFVEIKTNRHGWRKVRLLKVKSHNRVILKLPSGEVITRKTSNLHWGVYRKIGNTKPNKKELKKWKSKRRKRKKKKRMMKSDKKTNYRNPVDTNHRMQF